MVLCLKFGDLSFIDLENAYDRVNRETLWQVLRMYNEGGKLSACVRVKGVKGGSLR